MNKQEAIEEIKDEIKRNGKRSGSLDYLNGKRDGLVDALKIIKQIDEPEKPVVPQFVAEYIEYCKRDKFYALHGAYNNMDNRLKCWRFKGNNSELFAKAWLYGYEVEKEKLYIVFQPATHEFLYTDSRSLRSDAVTWAYAAETEEYHFTQQKLEELHYWNNQAFEIKEVTE